MKLVEKKCPNCGAKLTFEKTDKSVVCKYCNQSYEIERENNLDELIEDGFDPREFVLKQFKTVTKTSKYVTIFGVCIFIFIFIIFIIMFFRIFPSIMR